MVKDQDGIHCITTETDLNYLIDSIHNGKQQFADSFSFCSNDNMINSFFSKMGIDKEVFDGQCYFFDSEGGIYVVQGDDGVFWISNVGIVAKDKLTNNRYVNAFASQNWVMETLLLKAAEECSQYQKIDLNLVFQERVQEMSIAIYGNLILFCELFGKAYLSISKKTVKKTHKIKLIMQDVKTAMFEQRHNDSLFHVYYNASLKSLSDYLDNLPSDYNEAFIKYDDNNNDGTSIRFNSKAIKVCFETCRACFDMILDYYYCGNDSFFLHNGLFNRLIDKAKTDSEIERIKNDYFYLTNTLE